MQPKTTEPATQPMPSGPEAASELVEIAAALAEGRLPPPAIAARFAAAVSRWLLEGHDLEEALGLAGSTGRDSARTLYRRRRRDLFIRRAFREIEGPSPWQRCIQLAREIETFSSRVWPVWRQNKTPPPGASRLRTYLFEAARAWELPTTARRLHDICTWDF